MDFAGPTTYLRSADEALAFFGEDKQLENLCLVVLDLAMYTGKSMNEKQTGYGRITGDALRKALRTHWNGPVIVLSNSPDQGIRSLIEGDGDTFCRKPLTTPIELRKIAESRIAPV
jgi:hypothetical protein